MKPSWKKKWLAALRSGEYRQGRKYLRQQRKGQDRYCCLGVLCDLTAPKKWANLRTACSAYAHDSSGSDMPSRAIRVRAGIEIEDAVALADMNDTGCRFTTIARWIEENL